MSSRLRVVVDLMDMQVGQCLGQSTSFSFQLLQMLALRTAEIELFVVLSDHHLDSLKPTHALLETIVPKDHISIWYAPVQAKDNKRSKKQFAALASLREAFINDLLPDVLILPDYVKTIHFNAPVSISHLSSHTQLIVCISEAFHMLSSKKTKELAVLSRANLICCFSERTYHLLLNKVGLPQSLLSLQDLGVDDSPGDYSPANEKNFEGGVVQIVSQMITHTKLHDDAQRPEAHHGVEVLFKQLGKNKCFLRAPQLLKEYAKCIKLNHYSQRSKILYIDVSFLHLKDHKTGIQRVVRSLLSAFLKNPPAGHCVEPVFSVPGREGFYFARHFTAELMNAPEKNLLNEPIEPIWGDKFLGLDYTGDLLLHQANHLNMLHKRGVSVEFVVYDLLPILRPKAFPPKMFPVFKQWLDVVLLFDGVICISKAVSEEFHAYLQQIKHARPFQVRWFHLGADIESSIPTLGIPAGGETVLNAFKQKMTFLMVSTIEPRKGHVLALSAFEQLWAQGIDVQLVIVGKQGWKVDGLIKKISSHPELNKRLFWLDGISDEFLQQVYAEVDCFLGLSEAEGFGLPLIEAARYKLPIIARNIPVFKEIAKEHAYYFNGETAEALSQTMSAWMNLYQLNKHPKSDTMPWLTWVESANQLKAQMGIT